MSENTDDINVDAMSKKNPLMDISVSDMTSTLMISVYFTYQMKTISSTDECRRQRTHFIIELPHFCSCIKNDDNTTIGPC
jgi:hypothetical protein